MKTNKFIPSFTHEGGKAFTNISFEKQLDRSVLSCLLFENEFYEDGISIAERIANLASMVEINHLYILIEKVHIQYKLRHVPLFLIVQLLKRCDKSKLNNPISNLIPKICSRPDQMTELLALYWKEGKKPLSSQLKKGLAKSFNNFTEYQFAKYNRNEPIKLRDIMFLCHPKPEDLLHVKLFDAIANNTLETPDTWEVALSTGKDKKQTWERLLTENKLGYMALLRNLRNMIEANVDLDLIKKAILDRKGASKVLPFRFMSALNYAPMCFEELNEVFLASCESLPKLDGITVILVDVSGSMEDSLSEKSLTSRLDTACCLAALFKGNKRIFTFSRDLIEVPNISGLALIGKIKNSQSHEGTYLYNAMNRLNQAVKYDRIIVITDEQTQDGICDSTCNKSYMINIASNQNGVGYGKWIHIDGFSENVINFIHEHELSK